MNLNQKTIKSIISSFAVTMLLVASFSACDKVDDAISECDEPQNQITPTDIEFDLGCVVKLPDGTPLEGQLVKMDIYKEYCDGSISGAFEGQYTTRTNSEGFWDSHMLYTYTYKNRKDRVFVRYTVEVDLLVVEYYTFDFVYRWEDVSDEWGYVYKSPTLYIGDKAIDKN